MNTEELRIVRGNAFNIKIQVEAIRLDGTIIEHFHLADANAQLKVWHAGELTPKEFVVEDNNAIISFDGTQSLGWYGLEMSGTFEGAPWRFAVVQVFQIVETNEKANVPSWTILTDQTYFVEGVITMYASGATYQADWDETDTTSPSYIKNKPNLGVYATKSQLHSTEQQLQHNIDQEETRAKAAEQTLQGNLDAEETRAKAAEKQNADDIDAIEALIPEQASTQNQLADKNFVNNSISTSTATFRGTYNVVSDLSLTAEATHAQIEVALATKIATADNNDYCFVQIPTATATPTEIAAIERYKFNGTTWAYEYTLNNSGFTAAQWAAINSGITSADVVKLLALPTNSELTTLLNGKQDTISDLQTIREGAATGATAYQKPAGGIPSTDMTQAVQTSLQKADNAAPQSEVNGIKEKIPAAASAQNQLADKNFVNSSIATATATYRGSYNVVSDLSLPADATHAQIEAAIATKLAALGIVADNNDYCFVQIPTATATSTEIAAIERYKFNGTAWSYEYTLNNSGFTSDQWAAINSGITSGAVAKLTALPTNAELITLLNGKQDIISDLSTIRSGAAAGATAYQKPAGGIPSDDMTQAVQTSLQKADNAAPQDTTYTKAEVNGLVDTPHQEYVTVDAYSNLPATGSEDTIYRVSSYNGSTSQIDASVYSEYAWNGSQYIFLCVKSQIGEVFDISVYNNNVKYADLAAALNGGANIPQSLQKGGMSVKFVQSSDNNYVQFRYMGTETTGTPNPFLDVANWQGIVDTKNTAIFGDTNPISSKVIYPCISRIGNFDISVKLSNSSAECPVDIREGNVSIAGSTSAAMFIRIKFYNKNDELITDTGDTLSNTTFTSNIVLTDDCTKLVISSVNSGTVTAKITTDSNIDALISKHSGNIGDLYNKTDKIQTLENTKYTTANALIVGATNKYSLNGSSKIIFYPLEKTGTISYTPKDGVSSVLKLVSSNEVTDGMAVPYSDGGTVSSTGTNYTAASKYLLVTIKVTGQNRVPDAIYVNGYDILQDIVDNLINLKKEYNDNKNYVLPLVNKVPKLEEVTIGEDSFALTSSTSSTFDCLLPAGNLIFTFRSAASPAWVSVTAYDVEDNVVAASGNILIKANTEHEYIAACNKEIHKVVISNINSVVRTVDVVSDGSLSARVEKLEEKVSFDFDISIPTVVYLRTAQEFGIWYRNVIFGSQAFRNGNYSIRCQKKDGNTYSNIGTNCTYDKFNYVPSEEGEFDLEIRIINTYTEIVAFSKVVHFIVKNPANIVNKSPKIVLIGDSFTDAHSVSKYVWTFLEQDGFTPVSVGVNSAGYGSYKDDAWSGYGINWFCNTYYGYHRSDRPTSDDVVISGQTYTRNEFIEGSGDKFDFSYYMQHYHDSGNVDCVVFNVGLNDTIWHKLTASGIQSLLDDLDYMIDSVHDYDSNIKVILCTVTNQPIEDAYTSNYGNDFMTAETGKARQEKWNKALLEHFDTSEYKTAGVYLAPTNANFDANHAIYTTEIEPDKFDSSIKETITNDIHPDAIGAKYIADTIVNTIEGLLT